jgi:hypothetical protein
MSHRSVVAFAFGLSIAASSLLPVLSEGAETFLPPPFSPPLTQVVAAPSGVLGTDNRQPQHQEQTTALIVSAIGEPLYAQGSDGYTHIEYDLIFTNVTDHPVTLTSVQVFNDRGRQCSSWRERPSRP